MTWSKDPDRRRGQPKAQRDRIMHRHQGVCHLCGHPGSDQVDHVINVKAWLQQQLPGSPHRDSNLRPAHDQPCPTCGKRCHVDKTQLEARTAKLARSRRPSEQHPGRLSDMGGIPPMP